jgi:cysteinyl-tRNA synthetase
MSKRFGNITTPRDLKADGVDAGAIRLLMFQSHYRQKLDMTDEALAAAREGSRRLGEFDSRLRKGSVAQGSEWLKWGTTLEARVAEALDDDLNAPQAIAALFDAVREGNRMLDQGGGAAAEARATWARVVGILDVLPGTLLLSPAGGELTSEAGVAAVTIGNEPWAIGLANDRKAAKSRRDYKEADRIRDLLKEAGWEVRDARDGTVEVRRLEG